MNSPVSISEGIFGEVSGTHWHLPWQIAKNQTGVTAMEIQKKIAWSGHVVNESLGLREGEIRPNGLHPDIMATAGGWVRCIGDNCQFYKDRLKETPREWKGDNVVYLPDRVR